MNEIKIILLVCFLFFTSTEVNAGKISTIIKFTPTSTDEITHMIDSSIKSVESAYLDITKFLSINKNSVIQILGFNSSLPEICPENYKIIQGEEPFEGVPPC